MQKHYRPPLASGPDARRCTAKPVTLFISSKGSVCGVLGGDGRGSRTGYTRSAYHFKETNGGASCCTAKDGTTHALQENIHTVCVWLSHTEG